MKIKYITGYNYFKFKFQKNDDKKKSNSIIPTKFRYFLNHMIMKQIYKFGKFLAFF